MGIMENDTREGCCRGRSESARKDAPLEKAAHGELTISIVSDRVVARQDKI